MVWLEQYICVVFITELGRYSSDCTFLSDKGVGSVVIYHIWSRQDVLKILSNPQNISAPNILTCLFYLVEFVLTYLVNVIVHGNLMSHIAKDLLNSTLLFLLFQNLKISKRQLTISADILFSTVRFFLQPIASNNVVPPTMYCCWAHLVLDILWKLVLNN